MDVAVASLEGSFGLGVSGTQDDPAERKLAEVGGEIISRVAMA